MHRCSRLPGRRAREATRRAVFDHAVKPFSFASASVRGDMHGAALGLLPRRVRIEHRTSSRRLRLVSRFSRWSATRPSIFSIRIERPSQLVSRCRASVEYVYSSGPALAGAPRHGDAAKGAKKADVAENGCAADDARGRERRARISSKA